ncbi:MAG: flagellar protein FlgN [Clostridium sp.]|nr:flagellar protein FlgN [Clostridium sp.]
MNPQIKVIIYEEKNILKELLSLLDEQYDSIINKDIIQMDKIAGKLDETSKELAKIEIQRRNIMGSEASIKNIVNDCDDDNIKSAYEEIVSTLRMVQLQKEANDTLIKQKLFFTKKMINFIKPSKDIGVYNAYGRVGK